MTNRRVWMTGAAAGAAGVAVAVGVGNGWFRSQAPIPSREREIDLWSMRFAPLTGSELEMSRFKGKPLLLNFWATWCPPCVKELPLLERFQREHAKAGWQVIGLAVDNLAPVVSFLALHPVSFPIGLAGVAGVELSRRLGNATGALPFSLVFDRQGRKVMQRLGVVNDSDLLEWSNAMKP